MKLLDCNFHQILPTYHRRIMGRKIPNKFTYCRSFKINLSPVDLFKKQYLKMNYSFWQILQLPKSDLPSHSSLALTLAYTACSLQNCNSIQLPGHLENLWTAIALSSGGQESPPWERCDGVWGRAWRMEPLTLICSAQAQYQYFYTCGS